MMFKRLRDRSWDKLVYVMNIFSAFRTILSKLRARFGRMFLPGVWRLGTYTARPVELDAIRPYRMQHGQEMPKITIVIPTLNQGRYIEATLQSIVSQQYPNLELIVVDGGSTDSTLAIIKKYESRITWWVSEHDSGQTAAINKGFARATGEILAWINSDDLVAPGALKCVISYFLGQPEVQVLYGNRILINEDGLEIGRWILPRHSNRVLKWSDFVPQETLYWRQSAWNLVGSRLDENFRFAMDWDFLLRLSSQKININRIPEFLGLFRVHDQQKTSAQIGSIGLQEMLILRRRELGYEPTSRQYARNTWLYLMSSRIHEIFFFLRKKLRKNN
jgi:glycosyltransferase involved in cell wall biosynthesis